MVLLLVMHSLKAFAPSVFFFLFLSGLIFIFSNKIVGYGLSVKILHIGNIFIFFLSLISFLLLQKGGNAASPQILVRYFYISFLIKFILVAMLSLVYAKTTPRVNKISIITCMFFYIIYTFLEMRVLLKVGKKKNA